MVMFIQGGGSGQQFSLRLRVIGPTTAGYSILQLRPRL